MMYNFFGEKLFDEIVDGLAKSFDDIGTELGNFTDSKGAMRTDLVEVDGAYEYHIDLPGVAKEDIRAELKDGKLVVTATRGSITEDASEDGKYIRRERFYGEVTRSYPVEEGITKEDIKAAFDNGVLVVTVPKELPAKEEEDNTIIIG